MPDGGSTDGSTDRLRRLLLVARVLVGGAVVAGPQLLYGPLVIVPVSRPLRMLWIGAVAAVLVAGECLLATRDVSRAD